MACCKSRWKLGPCVRGSSHVAAERRRRWHGRRRWRRRKLRRATLDSKHTPKNVLTDTCPPTCRRRLATKRNRKRRSSKGLYSARKRLYGLCYELRALEGANGSNQSLPLWRAGAEPSAGVSRVVAGCRCPACCYLFYRELMSHAHHTISHLTVTMLQRCYLWPS